jgi:hypothetical protein
MKIISKPVTITGNRRIGKSTGLYQTTGKAMRLSSLKPE